MMFRNRHKKGQSLVEYSIVCIIIMAVFVAMKSYIKRGMQGRWKQAVDDFGDQYDPRYVNSVVTHQLTSSSNTTISIAPAEGGYYTNRKDESHTVEERSGDIRISQQGELIDDSGQK